MAFMGMNPAQMRTFETSLDAEAKRVRAVQQERTSAR